MRMYDNCTIALNEITRDVFSRGTESYDQTVQSKLVSKDTHGAKELLAYNYTILQPKLTEAEQMLTYAAAIFNKPHLKVEYAKAWLKEILQGNLNPGKAHMNYWPEYWSEYSEIPKNGKLAYTYSERLQHPIETVIEKLKESPYRRAAYAPVWNGYDINRVGQRRVPCTIGYHFLVRKDMSKLQLNVICMQRSCSLAEFLPLDIYKAIGLQQYVSKAINIPTGNFIHFISSLHCFYKDLKDITRVW